MKLNMDGVRDGQLLIDTAAATRDTPASWYPRALTCTHPGQRCRMEPAGIAVAAAAEGPRV